MNPVKRLSVELGQLRRVLEPADFRVYCRALVRHGIGILRDRTLVPADRAMPGRIRFQLGTADIVVPAQEMQQLLKGQDETPTFGGAREMYASNVYLRGFSPAIQADVAVDLGSNRGLFLMQAAKVLGAKTLIGVEPQAFYSPVFDLLAEANGINKQSYTRYERFAGSSSGPQTITLGEIMSAHGLDRIGFLKCDIEGGEFDVFLNDGSFLANLDNLAMELHPQEGDVAALAKRLVESGFEVRISDQFGQSIEAKQGHYLHASRTGELSKT